MIKQVVAIAFMGLFASQSYGAAIQNGDFGSCDFTGWEQFSDTSTIAPGDFSINNNAGDCSAVITADGSDAFVNILYQELDLTVADGSEIVLNLDFGVDSELTGQAPLSADYFAVYLHDGLGGFFDHTGNLGAMFDGIDMNGAASFVEEFVLDSSFNNAAGWFLEFQVVSNFDFAPAFLTLNSASLSERAIGANPVSAPSMLALLVLFASMVQVRRSYQSDSL